jgi:hypothetical protein
MRTLLGIVLVLSATLLAVLAGAGTALLVTQTHRLVEYTAIITILSAAGSWALFRMARTHWSREGPVSRKPVVALILLLVLSGSLVFAMARYQFRIKAFVWHIRHGDFLEVAHYRVPVPSYWWAEKRSADDAQLWNTKTGESIWLQGLPKSRSFTVEGWAEAVEQKLNSAENPVTGRHEIGVAGERFICLEWDYSLMLPGKLARKTGEKRVHLPLIDCMSGEHFEVMFFGGMRSATRHDFAEFYSLMAALRRAT